MWTRLQWYRRRRIRIAFLLLPALLYRAAIPAGLMPMIDDDGRLSIMICPGEVAVRQHHDVHAAHHLNHLPGPEKAEPTSAQHVPCPFALSAGPAPPPIVQSAASPAPRPGHVPAQIPARVFSPTIVRTQTARAPPASPNH